MIQKFQDFPDGSVVKYLPVMQDTQVQSLGWEDCLEKGKAIRSSILAWRSPGTILSMGSQRVGHDGATFTQHIQSQVHREWAGSLRVFVSCYFFACGFLNAYTPVSLPFTSTYRTLPGQSPLETPLGRCLSPQSSSACS